MAVRLASSAGRSRFMVPSRDYEPRGTIFPPCLAHFQITTE